MGRAAAIFARDGSRDRIRSIRPALSAVDLRNLREGIPLAVLPIAQFCRRARIKARFPGIVSRFFRSISSSVRRTQMKITPRWFHFTVISKDRLFRDEIFFVMFPIYSETRKRDVVTDNYLYPFFHLRHGDGLHGWQFWPVVGTEHKDVTTQHQRFRRNGSHRRARQIIFSLAALSEAGHRHRHRQSRKISRLDSALRRIALAATRFNVRAVAVL